MILRVATFCVVSLFVGSLVLFIGCSKGDERNDKASVSDSAPAPSRGGLQPSGGGGDDFPARSEKADPNVYIDSVPRGAEVILLPSDEKSADKEVVLGKTPLVVSASECKSMKFWIKMDMEEYLKQVEKLQGMDDWVKNFKSDQYFGAGGVMARDDYFNYDTATSQNTSRLSGGLVATGPVYTLGWPERNRLCALFIPKGKKASQFFSLMPESGTFAQLLGGWDDTLKNRYRFSDVQADEAKECIRRCGKYVCKVKDPFKDGAGRQYSITVQGGSKKDIIISTITEMRIIPGYND